MHRMGQVRHHGHAGNDYTASPLDAGSRCIAAPLLLPWWAASLLHRFRAMIETTVRSREVTWHCLRRLCKPWTDLPGAASSSLGFFALRAIVLVCGSLRSVRFLALVIVLAVSGCITLPEPAEYDHFLQAQSEGFVVYHTYADVVFLKVVGIRSLVLGERAADLDRLRTVYESNSKSRPAWKIDAVPALHDALVRIEPVLDEHVQFINTTLSERGWIDEFRPIIHLSLVEQDRKVDHFQVDRFLSRPTLHFVLPADPESPRSLEVSLINALSVIQHELVHFSGAFGELDGPTGREGNEQTNEEVLANLVQQCDRLALYSNFKGGSVKVSLPEPAASFAGNMDEALEAARSVGPSAEGQLIADWFFLGAGAGDPDPLSSTDFSRIASYCADWTATARDFVSIYELVTSFRNPMSEGVY
ncbi:hypothetical protein [Wenzhouxiangella sp. EGI_FJ10409]|uniref:hypothetical protein n=1 Tax=Wenzhouxiangella sp. EGI_FJ10409 TaxID=3243767 RepID=UPI0035DD40A5